MPVLPVKVCKTTSYGVVDAESVLKIDGKATVLSSSGAEKPWIMLDMGEASLSGYAVVHVKNVIGSPAPVLRLSYANFDRKLTELGEYDDHTRAAYMTRDVELPVLPANIGRRQGTQKRRLIARAGTGLGVAANLPRDAFMSDSAPKTAKTCGN